MEEVVNMKRKEEQRRRWLEELNKQRDETTERRRREKFLRNQVHTEEAAVQRAEPMKIETRV